MLMIVIMTTALAENLKVTTVKDGDPPVSAEENDWIYGIYNASSSKLSIVFGAGDPAVGVNIYKNEKDLVVSRLFSVNPRDTVLFPMAKYGSGNYKVVITMIEEEDDYIGKFTIR